MIIKIIDGLWNIKLRFIDLNIFIKYSKTSINIINKLSKNENKKVNNDNGNSKKDT